MGILRRRHSGFTIIELVVVVAVIGILVAITVVGYGAWRTQTMQNAVKSDLTALAGAMEDARNFGSGYPSSIPSSFTASENIQSVTMTSSSSGDYYCASAASAQDAATVFKISSENNTVTSGACTNYSGVIVGAGLRTWWKFNGNADDSSGSSNTGTVNGATLAAGQTGIPNTAYELNGTTNYITIPNSSSLQFGGAFSVSAWVRPAAVAARYGIFSTRTQNSAGSWQLEIGAGSGGTGRVAVSGVGVWIQETSDNAVASLSWYHIVFTKTDNSIEGGKLYVNGTLRESYNKNAYTITNNTDQKEIGRGTSGSQQLSGRLDDVRLYNRTLSQSDVNALYNAGAQ